MSPSGNLYGATTGGGKYGDGTVFEMIPPGNVPEQYEVIYRFSGEGGDGIEPTPRPLLAPAAQGGTWTESVIFDFADGVEGETPSAQLAIAPDGSLYGTDEKGGSAGNGAAVRIAP